MTSERPIARAHRTWTQLYTTRPLTLGAILFGWVGIYLAYRGHSAGVGFALLTTLFATLSLRRGRVLAERSRESLRVALDNAAARNRELERLRHLAAVLLQGSNVADLQREVAETAADLLQAEAAAVYMVVEEGRFLRVAAASGSLQSIVGMLIPVDASLAGWALTHDVSVICDDQDRDPRSFPPPSPDIRLRTTAIVPLRSAGVGIGTISVYNRHDGRPFGDNDTQLLETLGDQVVVGLDRASVLAESRASEQALSVKNQELRRATQLKSEFLANMSHELRTPLNAIIGFSDLILSGDVGEVNEVQRDFLQSVLRNGRHLLGLINSVLDLSKIEAGRMALSLGHTEMREAIRAVVTDTSSLRNEKSQTCLVEMDDDPLALMADAVRIRQILFNLLSNASKFTPDGGQITLSAVRARTPLPLPSERSADQPRLVSRDTIWVSVSDTGQGIHSGDMGKLFLEFSQVDSALNRQQQGTGLGLALCKSFVELHGGTIGAESIHGHGSTFWFILPVEGPVRRPGAAASGTGD